jgi:protein-S-isoprenylcysteine O-methyltransferase Ste14
MSKKKGAPPARTPPGPSATVPAKYSRLDVLERVVVLAFYGWFFWDFGSAYMKEPGLASALPLISESVTVFFLIIRRPAQTISPSVIAWLLALLPTVIPLLVHPVRRPEEGLVNSYFLGPPFLFAGIGGAIIAKIALGRSFGLVAAHRGLRLSGPYRLVRHPIYACYLLNNVGTWLLNPSWWNLGVYLAAWCLQIPRIFVEEKHLSQDPKYREYQKVVRYRLIPGVF